MKPKRLSSLGSMLDGVLARHGIQKQVLATQIVRTANEFLQEHLSAQAAKDLCALSFQNGVLTLASRNTVARYDGEGIAEPLKKALEVAFPSVGFSILVRLRPDAFRDL